MTSIDRDRRTQLGDHVLVARLSQDALGTVYRAIQVREGRFARLRLLESPELPRAAVLEAIQKKDAPHRSRSFHPPGRRETLAVAQGSPYLAWNETSGWTLDVVLAAARRSGVSFPIDGALRLVAGAAAALEHARTAAPEGEPVRHGLLWPGFVTISRNAEVWVRGFGLAAAVLPSLQRPGLNRLLAPYLAPEVRAGGNDESSDVYSLGVLLLELVTGRSPSPDALPRFVPDDPFSQDVAALARSAVARASQRLPSVGFLQQQLQKLIEDCPYETSKVDLVLFLDDLFAPDRSAHAAPAKTPLQLSTCDIPRVRVDEPGASRGVWLLRIAAGIASLAALAAVDLAVHHRDMPFHSRSSVSAAAASPSPSAAVVASSVRGGPAPARALPSRVAGAPEIVVAAALPANRQILRARRRQDNFAQVWRLRAALSRISAQQADASNLASESFREGRIFEKEGGRFLSLRKLSYADEAFEQAAERYAEAETLAHQERARVIRVSVLRRSEDGESQRF